METIYVKPVSLKRLHNLVDQGIFAVPELQREFVWTTRKVCDLLDSIFRKLPIGTIVIWKTDRRNENQLRKTFHILPHYNPKNTHIYFLVDGQQRLSVLWNLLRGEGGTVSNEDGKKLRFANFFFNPAAREGENCFLYRDHVTRDLREKCVPVVDLLSGSWRRRAGQRGVRIMKRIEECRRKILAYEVFLVFFETANRSEVRETFIRINSFGLRIGSADRAFARASKFDLRGLVRDVQTRLKNGFDQIQRTTILQVFALSLGIRDLGERAVDAFITRLESDDHERLRFEKSFPTIREAIATAADYFFYQFGVANLDFLPSEPMFAILSLYFFHAGKARPGLAAKQRLNQWFWATAVGARYTGRGYRPNLTADGAFVERLAANPQLNPAFNLRVRLEALRDTEYGRPGPLSNAFFCLLRLQGPRYLEDGDEIPLGEVSSRHNSREKHHIFPRALLSRHGIGPERFNSILNICYLVARDNRSIGQRAPENYFADVPKNKRILNSTLRSHLIPSKQNTGIWNKDPHRGFNQFLQERALLMAKAFEERAGIRIFDRSATF